MLIKNTDLERDDVFVMGLRSEVQNHNSEVVGLIHKGETRQSIQHDIQNVNDRVSYHNYTQSIHEPLFNT